MKFKAHIKLTEEQKKSRPVGYGNPGEEAIYFEFSIQHLIEDLSSDIYDADLREVLIPWLMAGNQPEIVELDDDNERRLLTSIGRRSVNSGGGIWNFPPDLVKRIMPSKEERDGITDIVGASEIVK